MAKQKTPRPAHRPLKFGEEIVFVTHRVPATKKEEFKTKVARILKKWEARK